MNKLELPLIAMRDTVIFPYEKRSLVIGRELSLKTLYFSQENNFNVILATQKDESILNPSFEDLFEYGVECSIEELVKREDSIEIIVNGIRAVKINYTREDNILWSGYEVVNKEIPLREFEVYKKLYLETIGELINISGINESYLSSYINISDPEIFSYQVANWSFSKKEERINILSLPLSDIITNSIIEIKNKISDIKLKESVRAKLEKEQEMFFLKAQQEEIKKRLHNKEPFVDEVENFRKLAEETPLSDEAREIVKQEIHRLQFMQSNSSEAAVIRNYLEWILNFPWGKYSTLNKDVEKAEEVLNSKHYGMEKVKRRILRSISASIRSPNKPPKNLLLWGPPGVGKTSICEAIAEATGRKFAKISLAGLGDSAQLLGNMRTYIGSLPGLIVQKLRMLGVSNPLIQLDEVDKLNRDIYRDPKYVLVSLLDPKENKRFQDLYLGFGVDISQVLFILTANSPSEVDTPILQRVKSIEVEGYTDEEKKEISKYLVEDVRKNLSLEEEEVNFTPESIDKIIRDYTKESGVRALHTHITDICEGVLVDISSGKIKSKTINPQDVDYYLRDENKVLMDPYFSAESDKLIGVGRCLAWSNIGGSTTPVETILFPGKGNLILTGNIGKTMEESAKIALSCVKRVVANELKEDFFSSNDFHVHIPYGGIEKDGPSAGIAMFSSILSAVTKKAIKYDFAMTGEISLNGLVLPIGGLKEKITAAIRTNQIKEVLVPYHNQRDIERLPKEITSKIKIHFVRSVDQVIKILWRKNGRKD